MPFNIIYIYTNITVIHDLTAIRQTKEIIKMQSNFTIKTIEKVTCYLDHLYLDHTFFILQNKTND